MTAESTAPARRTYVAMALVAGAVLLYEVAITRVLSVILWYHFAFLSISLAMLGLGLPGVWYSLRAPRPGSLRLALLVAGAAVPTSIVVIFQLGYFTPIVGALFPSIGSLLHARVILALACVFVPLLALGSAVCLMLLQAPGRSIGRMYGADLLGATVGALLVVPLMTAVPTPVLLAGAGFLPLIAAGLVYRPVPRAAIVIAVLIGCVMLWGEPLRLRYGKQYREPENLRFEKWTPTARITVFPDIFFLEDKDTGFVWGMGEKFDFSSAKVDQLWLEQDGSAGTPITRLAGDPADLTYLFYDVTSVGYQVDTPPRTCIIGAGGGRDILTALKAGATEVDAVELNPHIIEAVSGPFGEFSGDVYHRPGVRAIASEGRSYLTRAVGDYDMVQISLIDSWAATAAGAYALSENYLYTVEAMRLYWHRLAPHGMVSVTRWIRGVQQLESTRVALLAARALELEGVERPLEHVAAIQASAMATVLVARDPWTGDRLARLRQVCDARGFTLLWPVTDTDAVTAPLIVRTLRDGVDALAASGFAVTPPTDDKPFFFQTVPIFGRTEWLASDELSTNDHAAVLLRMLLTVMTVATLALFCSPFVLARRLERHPGFWRGAAYFTCIGLAFMLAEAPWVQRFILYLGHPSYATTVVIAALLLGAGVGALTAARIPAARAKRLGFLLPAAVAALTLTFAPIFTTTLGLPFPARVLLSACALVPTGFLMGFAFPLGMMQFGDGNKAWFWALNGAAGVLATVFSLALAMTIGFTLVSLVGAAFYFVAWLLLPAQSYVAEPAA